MSEELETTIYIGEEKMLKTLGALILTTLFLCSADLSANSGSVKIQKSTLPHALIKYGACAEALTSEEILGAPAPLKSTTNPDIVEIEDLTLDLATDSEDDFPAIILSKVSSGKVWYVILSQYYEEQMKHLYGAIYWADENGCQLQIVDDEVTTATQNFPSSFLALVAEWESSQKVDRIIAVTAEPALQ